MIRVIAKIFYVLLVVAVAYAAGASSPFATSVINYSPGPGQWVGDPRFNDPVRALGRPYGKSVWEADNTSVVTLGDGGSLTLAFDHNVVDDPRNPGGFDFIVFGNAIFVGGNPAMRWQEPAFVEISQDGVEWFLVMPNILPSQLTASDTGPSSTILRHYADCTPVLELPYSRTAEEFYTVPDRQSRSGDFMSLMVDEVSGGGDAFDIAAAVRQVSPGVPMFGSDGKPVPAGITWFRYIRMTDALVGDSWGAGEISAEIDAVADVSPAALVGEARRLPDSSFAVIWGAAVTAVFEDGVWIEQLDRSAGIRIAAPSTSVAEGDLVAVTGHVITQNGEKILTDPLVTVLQQGGSNVKPVGLCGSSLSSGSVQGMLVTVWGRVNNKTGSGFTLDRGFGSTIGVITGSVSISASEGAFVSVTGVMTKDSVGASAVRIRRAEDVKTF